MTKYVKSDEFATRYHKNAGTTSAKSRPITDRSKWTIEKSNLSRLENTLHPNPAMDTLTRYADAIGKEIVSMLVERDS